MTVAMKATQLTGHLFGCPAGRTEYFTSQRPGTVLDPRPQEVGVVRCMDCGSYDVVPVAQMESARAEAVEAAIAVEAAKAQAIGAARKADR